MRNSARATNASPVFSKRARISSPAKRHIVKHGLDLQIRVSQIRILQIRVLQIRVLQIQSVFYKSNPVHILQYTRPNGLKNPCNRYHFFQPGLKKEREHAYLILFLHLSKFSRGNLRFAPGLKLSMKSQQYFSRVGVAKFQFGLKFIMGRVFISGFSGRLASDKRKSRENSCFPTRFKLSESTNQWNSH